MTVSIVIPTYNEESTIAPLLSRINDSLAVSTKVIIVDDGSSDDTISKALSASSSLPIQVIQRNQKMGLGSALKKGLQKADGEIVVQMDADLSHQPEQLPTLVERCTNHDVVIGSRYIEGGERNDGIYRYLLPRIASWLYSTTLDVPIKDITSGFKAYTSDSVDILLDNNLPNGYSFQPATVYTLVSYDKDVVEVPITFNERSGGTSKYDRHELLENISTYVQLVLYHYTGRSPRYHSRAAES